MGILRNSNGIIKFSGGGIVRPFATSTANPDNFATFQNVSGSTITNYPMQLGRGFIEGELEDYPQVLIDGVPVATQSHVEQRWDDDTVKHAVLFFILPTLANNATATFTFGNQATSNTSGGLTAANVLADWDFEATLAITKSGETRTASARDMLAAGSYTEIFSGPIATQFMIVDHTVAAAHDFGWDGRTPLRPIFYATLWPSTGQTRVRYVVENCNTEKLESLTGVTNVTCTIGQASPTTVHTETPRKGWVNLGTFFTFPQTFPTNGYWKGGTPTDDYVLDHNLWYWGQTKLMPCYDTTVSMQASQLTSYYNSWTSANKTIYDHGDGANATVGNNFNLSQVTGGGHKYVGMYDAYGVYYMYEGTKQTREIMNGMASMYGWWPGFFREGQFGRARAYQRNGVANAGGRSISINARPTLFFQQGFTGAGATVVADRLVPVDGSSLTSLARNGFGPEAQHRADPWSIPYLTTGEHYYLNALWMDAAYQTAWPSPANVTFGARGPQGWYGGNGLDGESRGIAWIIRHKAHAWAYTPERYAEEKEYYRQMAMDAIEGFEGTRLITSPRVGGTMYTWGSQATWLAAKWSNSIPPPLRFVSSGTTAQFPSQIDYPPTHRITAHWMDHYAHIVFGRALELGLPTDAIMDWLSPAFVDRTHEFPFSWGEYYSPCTTDDGTNHGVHITSWADVVDNYVRTYAEMEDVYTDQIIDTTIVWHTRPMVASGAAAFHYGAIGEESTGADAWAWHSAQTRESAIGINASIKSPNWNFVPRALHANYNPY